MDAAAITRTTVSAEYVLLTIELAEERGVSRGRLLEDVGVSAEMLTRPDARVTLLQYGYIIARALRLTGDPGLGFEYGLRANLTLHGLVGFGVMSHRTLRDALAFGSKYFSLRSPGFTRRCLVEGSQVVIDVREALQYGPLRQYAFEMLLVGLTHTVRPFVPESALELWFEWPEPECYARYRHRLPPTRFNMGQPTALSGGVSRSGASCRQSDRGTAARTTVRSRARALRGRRSTLVPRARAARRLHEGHDGSRRGARSTLQLPLALTQVKDDNGLPDTHSMTIG